MASCSVPSQTLADHDDAPVPSLSEDGYEVWGLKRDEVEVVYRALFKRDDFSPCYIADRISISTGREKRAKRRLGSLICAVNVLIRESSFDEFPRGSSITVKIRFDTLQIELENDKVIKVLNSFKNVTSIPRETGFSAMRYWFEDGAYFTVIGTNNLKILYDEMWEFLLERQALHLEWYYGEEKSLREALEAGNINLVDPGHVSDTSEDESDSEVD